MLLQMVTTVQKKNRYSLSVLISQYNPFRESKKSLLRGGLFGTYRHLDTGANLIPASLVSQEFERRPDLGLMVTGKDWNSRQDYFSISLF